MVQYSVPAIRRLQLGRELRDWRERAGLTLDQAGGDLDMSKSTLSRLEKGQGVIHPLVARAMAELYHVPEDDLVHLVEISREARKPNQDRIEGVSSDSYVSLESEAVSVHNFELVCIPGLLQTEDYARAIFTLDSTRERNRNLSIRLSRRKRLFGDNPLRLHVIIDEPALRRPVLDSAGAREQLDYLLMAAEFPNVTLRILPASRAVHPALRGAFSVLSFPQDTIGDLGYADYAGGSLQMVKPGKVSELSRLFRNLAKLALDESNSKELLASLADEPSA
ncbi:MAG: putative DNA-binding protein [Amycolatopsis sp.]|uniref:helix-turn-helix domain-containing protein n=1 Tax=Amycolatopsis sp. TaxID=37632 RepID=UPI00261EAD0C|nr:helix-turn-helix transcriptional regulator [Amycolatopsis sp.]MCU1682126.1 putative DNA-binding protein [Amycolatopsis sp.]